MSPDPKVLPESDTAKLQELIIGNVTAEIVKGLPNVKDATELAGMVRQQTETLRQHEEAIRLLRGTALEQDSRLKAALAKLNLTIAATDKLDDAMEMVEVDQSAVTSDFREMKSDMQQMQAAIAQKEIEQDSKLVRLVEQRHIDVQVLTTEIKEKMAIVEASFVKAEGVLYELTADKQKYDKLVHDLNSAVAASGPAGPGVASSVEVAVMKARMEHLSQELAGHAAATEAAKRAATDAEDKLVGVETNTQSAVAQITEFMLQTVAQAQQATLDQMARREQIIAQQLEKAVAEANQGACHCPSNCPGRRDAPTGMPPRCEGSGEARRPPFLNGSGTFNGGSAPCGNGRPAGGLGGAPGGSGGPSGPGAGLADRHDIFTDDGHKKLFKSSKSPFDTKAARDELPRYNGKDKAELWRKKVTYYLHSRNANMKNLLRWAELEAEPITSETLTQATYHADTLAMLSDDAEVLSYHLWGFLNVNLTDAAWDLFDGVTIENGLEVWRVVNLEITQKTQSELLALEDLVLTPARVHEIKDIDRALVSWDAALRNYLEAGGTSLSKHRQVGAIMRLIPIKVRDQALWEFDKFDGKPDVLRKWIRERTSWFTKADAGRSSAARAHLLEGDLDDLELTEEEEQAVGMMSDEQLHAFVRRKAQLGQRTRDGPRKPRREQPPRDKRDVTCPNCLKKGHTSQECKEPKIASKDRKCFECGLPGHIASKCPNKDAARVLDDGGPAGGSKPVWMGVVASSDEVPVHRKRMIPMKHAILAKPTPKGCTLGDCMGSAFLKMAALEQEDEEEKSRQPSLQSASEAHPGETSRVPDTGYDAEGQWELLKHSIPGYAAIVKSRNEAKRQEYLKEEQQRGLAAIRELFKEAEEEPVTRQEHHETPKENEPLEPRPAPAPTPVPPPVNGEHAGRVGVRGNTGAPEQAQLPPRKLNLAAEFQSASRECTGTCCTEVAKRRAARRRDILASKERAVKPDLRMSWRRDAPLAPAGLNNFWGVEAVDQIHMLPDEEEPEFIEIEMTLDTGATVHAADRIDFPGCLVLESLGSKAGQHFQAAGGKLIANEGQANIVLTTLAGIDLAMTMQIAKITRPLLSVTKMTESGDITVLCKRDVALVLDKDGRTVATFNKKGGLYVCMMKYRNPKFRSADFARPHE